MLLHIHLHICLALRYFSSTMVSTSSSHHRGTPWLLSRIICCSGSGSESTLIKLQANVIMSSGLRPSRLKIFVCGWLRISSMAALCLSSFFSCRVVITKMALGSRAKSKRKLQESVSTQWASSIPKTHGLQRASCTCVYVYHNIHVQYTHV